MNFFTRIDTCLQKFGELFNKTMFARFSWKWGVARKMDTDATFRWNCGTSQLFKRVKLEIRMRLFLVTPDHSYNWLYPDWLTVHAYLRQRPDQYSSFIWDNELFPSSHRAEVLQKPEACKEYWIFFSIALYNNCKAWPRYPSTSHQSISYKQTMRTFLFPP